MSHNDDREEVAATLTFDPSVDIQKVMRAEELLREAGVSFDTGTAIAIGGDGDARREWELDWSLQSATLYKHDEQDPPTP